MGSLGGYGYGNYQNKTSMCKTTPPLSAIQRFLLDNNNKYIFSTKTSQHNEHVDNEGSVNEYRTNFAFPSGGNGEFSTDFVNNGFYGSESDRNWMQSMYPNLGLNQTSELPSLENMKYFGKKAKGSSFIKGQWTDEEDRVLIDLVIKYGEKRWAKIAEQMHGRAGKQCRERWHNHLRPDIKKDIWSEEEERMLIEAHIQVGNKWAEIAKRIPGRTENSIKNHWNATKRRQNSKRKCKKAQEGQTGKSMLLQEYQVKIFSTVDKSDTTTPTESTITVDKIENFSLSFEDLSESSIDDHSPQLFNETYDDELNFMINFFAKKSDQPSNANNNNNNQAMKDQVVGAYKDNNEMVFPNSVINSRDDELPAQTYLSSDRYISYLLDGPTNNFPNCINGYYGNLNVDFMGSSSHGKEDMDLMEMVASHQMFSYGGNNNSNFKGELRG